MQPVTRPWSRTAEDVVAALGVDPRRGLTDAEVQVRRREVGPNQLRQLRQRSAWAIATAQFKSVLVLLLAAAMMAAAAFGDWVEAGAILAVLLINALLGFVTELKAARSVEALRKMGATSALVRRDGDSRVVPAADLVPGDVVLLEGGDVVTADLRLLEASKLQLDESTLTGESIPTGKSVEPVAEEAPIGDRRSVLFKGTIVTRGSAEAVVVATGMASELGRISRLVEEAQDETTPLEQRLERLGRGLVWVTLGIAALVAFSGYLSGAPLLLMIETAIALAVAAVPEGLPVIATIALARGMYRMARHRALVNRLAAVETLGATSIICTDKTGTLTENRIRVEVHRLADLDDARRRALEIGALCNNAVLRDGDEGVGDPLEVALLVASEAGGVRRAELLQRAPERREVAFDPELKLMATVHGAKAPFRVAVKGAPEAVLEACELDAAARARWLAESERLATDGLRVLALAEREAARVEDRVYERLEFVGLVGMFDPPREGVRDTVAACQRAGVRVVMVTGDHPVTARSIALAAGLTEDPEADVVLGSEIAGADRGRLLQAAVFARVSPKQKLDLIALHQDAGAVVAMTGDGVNDAPALRRADIGVAMGGRGTAAAREAADMILEDDELSTVVTAIGEGRAIFDNIRNFVVYLLSCNIGEVLVVALASLAGAPLPLMPLQILFLNLVTDVFPALALGVGERSSDALTRPPRPKTEAVLTRRHWIEICAYGALLAAAVLAAFAYALGPMGLAGTDALTISFLTLALAQLWHVLNMRRVGGRVVSNEITRNPWVWAALALCVGILAVALYAPPLARLLSIAPPDARGWVLIGVASLVPLVVGQAVNVARGARRARRGPR